MDAEASSSRAVSDENLSVRSENESKELEDDSAVECDSSPHLRNGIPESKSDGEAKSAHTHSTAMSPVFLSKNSAARMIDHYLPTTVFEIEASNTAASGRPYKNGNIYNSVEVSADARAHLGDVITINNYHGDSTEAKEKHMVARIEITEEFFMALPAAIALAKNLLQTATGLLILLQVTMSAYRLPKQISDELAVFEDALGRFQRVDLRFVDSWSTFRRRLECDFEGTPGSRRILEMKYRLFDRAGGNYLIDPRNPPPFAVVFKQDRHVQMSIHFEWNEVSDEQCPRHRGQIETASRAEEVDNEETAVPEDIGNIRRPSTASLKEQDAPSSFSRITISKQPVFAPPPSMTTASTLAEPPPTRHPIPLWRKFQLMALERRNKYFESRQSAKKSKRRAAKATSSTSVTSAALH